MDWNGKKPLKGLRQNGVGGVSGSFTLWKSSLASSSSLSSLLTIPLGLRKVPALEDVAFCSGTHINCR